MRRLGFYFVCLFFVLAFSGNIIGEEALERAEPDLDLKKNLGKPVLEVIQEHVTNQKPKFEWTGVDDAEEYILYIQSDTLGKKDLTLINGKELYRGSDLVYISEDKLDFGSYTAWVVAKKGTTLNPSEKVSFVVEKLQPPQPLNLLNDEVTFDTRPKFKWSKVQYATNYSIRIDELAKKQEPIYAGRMNDYKIKQDLPKLDLGKHKWKIWASNKYQTSESVEATFIVKVLPDPLLITPSDGSEILFRYNNTKILLSWERIFELEPELSRQITYKLYINGNLYYDGKDISFRPKVDFKVGSYEWYVEAYGFSQRTKSKVWKFAVVKRITPPPKYFDAGAKGGFTMLGTSDLTTAIGVTPNTSVYLEYKMSRYVTIELNPTYKQKSFDIPKSNHISLRDDVSVQGDYFTIPILIKPMYKWHDFTFFAMVGPEINILVSSRLINGIPGGHASANNYFTKADVNLFFGVGMSYTISKDIDINVEVRYNLGLANSFAQTFMNQAAAYRGFEVIFGTKVIEF